MNIKNAEERPESPTARPSELSIKLNAFVNVVTHKIVNK